MGRKRTNSNPVSLFAFQDIITSITGIMVLVVLLIILDIISHKEKSSSKSVKQNNSIDIKNLEKRITELNLKLNDGDKWLIENEKIIREVLALNFKALPEMIKKEEKKHIQLQKMVEQLKEKNAKLQSQEKRVKNKIKNRKIKIEVTVKQIEESNKRLLKGKELLKQMAINLEKKKVEIKKRKNIVEIRTSDTLNKSPIFVECSDSVIKVKIIKKPSSIYTFANPEKDYKKLLNNLQEWLNNSGTPAEESIVVIVKPSSANYIKNLCEILENRGFEYNLEPMQENKTGIYK